MRYGRHGTERRADPVWSSWNKDYQKWRDTFIIKLRPSESPWKILKVLGEKTITGLCQSPLRWLIKTQRCCCECCVCYCCILGLITTKNILFYIFCFYCVIEFFRCLVFPTDCLVFSILIVFSPRSNIFASLFSTLLIKYLSFLTTLTIFHSNN